MVVDFYAFWRPLPNFRREQKNRNCVAEHRIRTSMHIMMQG
jgi:hypothetical protein